MSGWRLSWPVGETVVEVGKHFGSLGADGLGEGVVSATSKAPAQVCQSAWNGAPSRRWVCRFGVRVRVWALLGVVGWGWSRWPGFVVCP